jgi:hypothetical protein
MFGFLDIIIPVFLILIFLIYLKQEKEEVAYIESNIDGKEYLVINKPDKQQAADTLALVRRNLIELVEGMKKTKHPKERSENVQLLLKRFNPDVIVESGAGTEYSTYTLNKGEKIVFCLRARDSSQKLHNINLLTFVAIHELGHIMTKSTGHTEEFKKNFLYLLENSIKMGIYAPVNYRANPKVYCGIDVTDTPLGDEHFTFKH